MGADIGTAAIHTHPARTHAQARAIKHPPTTPAATCRHPSGIVKPAGVQVRTVTGTVARTTEMIAEIHDLGDYLGEFRRIARGTRSNRGSVGPNHRVHDLGDYLGEFRRIARGTRSNQGSVGPNHRVCPYSLVFTGHYSQSLSAQTKQSYTLSESLSFSKFTFTGDGRT